MSRRPLQLGIAVAALLGSAAFNPLAAQTPEKSKSGQNKTVQTGKKNAEKENVAVVLELSDQKAPSEADLRTLLGKPVEANLRGVPLNKLIPSIAKTTGGNIWIDEIALTEEGVTTDEPVSHKGKPIAAARLLDRILKPLGLTWIIQDHVVQVTTVIAAEEILITRTHPVGDLIEYSKTHQSEDMAQKESQKLKFVQFGGGGTENLCAPLLNQFGDVINPSPEDWLIDLLQQMTAGHPWADIDGTGGSLSFLNNNLVIRQTQKVQWKCERILDTVRQFTKGELKDGTVAIRPPHYAIEEDVVVKKALTKVISVKCKDLPLDKFLEALSKKLDAPIHADEQALTEEGVAMDEPISRDIKHVPAGSLLNLALYPLGLTGIVEDGRVIVTTIIAADERIFTKFHDIRDLHESSYGGTALIDLLQQETSGPWGDVDGTGGTPAIPLDGLFAVWQTEKVHNEIEAILADLRKEMAKAPGAKKKEPADPQAVTTKFYVVDSVADLGAVRKAIVSLIEADSWTENGKEGAGDIIQIDQTLVIKNRNEVHAKVKGFLDDLKKSTLQNQATFRGNSGSGGFGGGAPNSGGGGSFFRVSPAKRQSTQIKK